MKKFDDFLEMNFKPMTQRDGGPQVRSPDDQKAMQYAGVMKNYFQETKNKHGLEYAQWLYDYLDTRLG